MTTDRLYADSGLEFGAVSAVLAHEPEKPTNSKWAESNARGLDIGCSLVSGVARRIIRLNRQVKHCITGHIFGLKND